ncbi:hypothetical protein [Streptomyces pulveraceus]|uniref:Uncharacterized protein n=1 Tax=Streptomyces pulveraceus TaxID=68258 RepID=A0ABW1GNK4_9ACTN
MRKIKIVPRLCVTVLDGFASGSNSIETGASACRLATTRAHADQQPATLRSPTQGPAPGMMQA